MQPSIGAGAALPPILMSDDRKRREYRLCEGSGDGGKLAVDVEKMNEAKQGSIRALISPPRRCNGLPMARGLVDDADAPDSDGRLWLDGEASAGDGHEGYRFPAR